MYYMLLLITLPVTEENPENTNNNNAAEPVVAEPSERSVHFTVSDGTGPVSGASVLIDGETSRTTGDAGGCNATLTDGEHTIAVTKEGYVDYEDTVTVSSDDTDFTITLTEE